MRSVIANCRMLRLFSFVLTLGAGIGHAASSSLPFFQTGRVEFRPHLAYSGSYEDGLLFRPGLAQNSYLDTFAPGLLVNIGETWSVDYTPSFTYYSNPAFRDTLNHSAVGRGHIAFRDFSFEGEQAYTYQSAPLVETGRQTDTEVVTSSLNASHPFSPKFLIRGSVQQKLTFVSTMPDFYEWTASGGFETKLSRKFTLSIDSKAGYVVVYDLPDMLFAQPGVNLTWIPTPKLFLQGGVSLDERAILARKWHWREAPVFSGNVRFEPFSVTRVQGKVARTISPSFFGGQTSDSILAGVSGEQRLLQHFWLSGGLDYTYSDYLTIGTTNATRRHDHVWTYNAAIRTTFRKRGTISVSYRDTDNNSNIPGFSHESSRIACEIGYRY
jgi:hypothetical protein